MAAATSARWRARSAPQAGLTLQDNDATPPPAPKSRAASFLQKGYNPPHREGRFRRPVSLKSIGRYDDVNKSSYYPPRREQQCSVSQ